MAHVQHRIDALRGGIMQRRVSCVVRNVDVGAAVAAFVGGV